MQFLAYRVGWYKGYYDLQSRLASLEGKIVSETRRVTMLPKRSEFIRISNYASSLDLLIDKGGHVTIIIRFSFTTFISLSVYIVGFRWLFLSNSNLIQF